jgi:hypothetical protein
MREVARHGHWLRKDPGLSLRLRDDQALASLKYPIVSRASRRDKEHPMLDIVMLALGFGFFAAAVGYSYACERL